MSAMSRPYDYQREAQAAMSMALAATGDDRHEWVRVAVAWQQLARNAADHGRVLTKLGTTRTSAAMRVAIATLGRFPRT